MIPLFYPSSSRCPRSGGMKEKKKKKPALHKIEFTFYAEGGCSSGGYCVASDGNST